MDCYLKAMPSERKARPSLKIIEISWANVECDGNQYLCIRIYPWFLDLGLRFLLYDFLKDILLCYDIAICNLSPASFKVITCFRLLNQWYGVELDLALSGNHTFRMFFFKTRTSLGTSWLLMGIRRER
ncbi:hypothetical protein DVH24_015530 [Malus domestica]|uniref:Uncharacterized protein n=1 Tax=Malus domestica TaxID=3750 RepID=A0A498HHD0_MALDO|nr:hypothetical protein DVH24_015530 [Malus domestica]